MGLIRFLLSISVLLAHYKPILDLGFIGSELAVESFFVISGFYMTMILNEKYIDSSFNKLFFRNRFLKIYPIYFIVLLMAIFTCAYIQLNHDNLNIFECYKNIGSNLITWFILIFSNIIIFGQDILMFFNIDSIDGHISLAIYGNFNAHSFLFLPQSWSLSIELLFYLIAPYILRKKISFVFVFLLLSFLIRVLIFDFLQLNFDPWSYRFFPAEFLFFLLGYFAYKIEIKELEKYSFYLLIFILSFTVFYYKIPLYGGLHIETLKQFYLCIIIISLKPIFKLTKDSKIDLFLGELSYPIYLIHTIVILIVTSVLSDKFQNIYFILGCTGFASIIIKILFIDRINKFRHNKLIKCAE
jgi:peptidoglycan/LPS O-acetylase OafA/YrhL